MLTLSDEAVDALVDVMDGDSEIPEEAGGLRLSIAQLPGEHLLVADYVTGPVDGDRVVEESGARVFVERDLSPDVANQELDATRVDGRVAFRLRPQDDGEQRVALLREPTA
jgi:iron-sulfur cluster assembly protein